MIGLVWHLLKKTFGEKKPQRTEDCPDEDDLEFFIAQPYSSDDPVIDYIDHHVNVKRCRFCREYLVHYCK